MSIIGSGYIQGNETTPHSCDMNIAIKSIKNVTKSPYTQQQYHEITIRKKFVANKFKVMLISKIKTIENHDFFVLNRLP